VLGKSAEVAPTQIREYSFFGKSAQGREMISLLTKSVPNSRLAKQNAERPSGVGFSGRFVPSMPACSGANPTGLACRGLTRPFGSRFRRPIDRQGTANESAESGRTGRAIVLLVAVFWFSCAHFRRTDCRSLPGGMAHSARVFIFISTSHPRSHLEPRRYGTKTRPTPRKLSMSKR
jgi:hypothetical protein